MGERTRANERKHFTVKTLNINVETPPGIDPSRLGFPKLLSGRKGIKDSVLDPEYITQVLKRLLNNLVYGWFDYGKVSFEHVDEVCLGKDGEAVWKADVAERLRDYPGPDEEMDAYKKEAWRLRKERGLKVFK